jgi:predicted Zn-ribbon and HTH transcriptional regulator
MSNSNDSIHDSGDNLSSPLKSTKLQPPMLNMDVVHVTNGECVCPHCNNKFYVKEDEDEDEKSRLMCNRCNYAWYNRIETPSKCPKCGSYAWNKPSLKCKCNVCSHKWISRKKEGPARCPSCNSTRWAEEPKSLDITIRDEDAPSFNKKSIVERYEKGKGCVAIASDLGLPLFKVISVVKSEIETKVSPRL